MHRENVLGVVYELCTDLYAEKVVYQTSFIWFHALYNIPYALSNMHNAANLNGTIIPTGWLYILKHCGDCKCFLTTPMDLHSTQVRGRKYSFVSSLVISSNIATQNDLGGGLCCAISQS